MSWPNIQTYREPIAAPSERRHPPGTGGTPWSCGTCATSPRWRTPATSAAPPSASTWPSPRSRSRSASSRPSSAPRSSSAPPARSRLTPAGEFMKVEVARILAAVEDSVRGVRRIADGRQGLVRIAFTGSAAHTQLPRMARIVKRELPGLALEIHADLLTPAQVDGLVDGRLDLGVLRPPMAGEGLEQLLIETEPLRPGRRRRPPPRDRAGHLDDRPAHREVRALRRRPTRRSTTPSTAAAAQPASSRACEHEAAGISVLLPLVAADLGVALVPASVRAAPLTGCRLPRRPRRRDRRPLARLAHRRVQPGRARRARRPDVRGHGPHPSRLPQPRPRGQPMKITQVEAIPFAIPYAKPLKFASGEVHVAEHVLVRVHHRRRRRRASPRRRPVPSRTARRRPASWP